MSDFTRRLARVMVAGSMNRTPLVERIIDALKYPDVQPAVVTLVNEFSEAFETLSPRPTFREIHEFLLESRWTARRFFRVSGLKKRDLKRRSGSIFNPDQPVPVREEFRSWELPQIASRSELLNFLEINDHQLEWLSGRFRSRGRIDSRYSLRILKQNRKLRILAEPQPFLKTIQRRLLDRLFNHIPVHTAAHGFRRDRSIHTFVEPHVAQHVVWRTDLAHFFNTIHRARISGFLQAIGYGEEVAGLISRLVTCHFSISNVQKMLKTYPDSMSKDLKKLLSVPHLPQGAPTSPSLANSLCYRLDCRLAGLAKKFNVSYTRYADDLAFSGDQKFHRSLSEFKTFALAIILDAGFTIRARKSVVMPRSRQQKLAGVILNEKPNNDRREYKQLRAILHNCVRFGPESQNHDGHIDFQAHLRGRIAWTKSLNENRGNKLEQMFELIDWSKSEPLP